MILNYPPPPIDQIRAVRNRVKSLLKHEERKFSKQQADVLEAGQYARYGQIADSLMADPAATPRGTHQGAVLNIHTNTIEDITLNPALDALENAEILYRKARKGKRGHETAEAMAEETAGRIERLKEVIAGIDGIMNAGDTGAGGLSEQRENLTDEDADRVREIAAEFLPADELSGKPKKNVIPPPPFKKYVIDGWEIFLGKNSRQNDEISTRFAKPSDIWLHVVGYAGSHVIIRNQKNAPPPPKEVVQKAAQLAVWHSKAKHTSYAEVHVTEARFVRKRRHAPPGEVIAERCKLIRVEPKNLTEP